MTPLHDLARELVCTECCGQRPVSALSGKGEQQPGTSADGRGWSVKWVTCPHLPLKVFLDAALGFQATATVGLPLPGTVGKPCSPTRHHIHTQQSQGQALL